MEENRRKTETHPWEPFLPDGARLLMLGSFPPPRNRWKMDFYYPNFQNDMWRIFGLVFFGEKDYFLTEDKKSFCEPRIREFLERKGIALSDTGREVIRGQDNASDKFLEIVRTLDLEEILAQLPECRAIVTTGQKATDSLLALVNAEQPKVGEYSEFEYRGRALRLYRMPSSSRAYPKPLPEKAEAYKRMFAEIGML
ncbi:MAG: uracil-DNA glycosylase family protein [Odoribacter sp.]|nr:uracil-DNA glycosylase family protein [Odoribacter sp.]